MKLIFKRYQKVTLFLATLLLGMMLSLFCQADYNGLGTESVSSDTIKKFAPPQLNISMANHIRNLLDVTAPGMGILSPDKKTLYFTWKVTGTNQVWKIDGPQKFPVQLTSGQDSVQLLDVSQNGEFLIISKDLNGQENPGLYKLDIKTGYLHELYRKAKVQAQFSFLSEDSQWLFFAANDVKTDAYNIYKLNLKTLEKILVFEGDGAWFVADHKENGNQLLLVKYNGARLNEYYEFNINSKKLIPLIGQNESNEYEVSYGARENEYLVLTAVGNYKKLYLYQPLIKKNREGLKPITDENVKYDISGFDIDYNRKRILYTLNQEGYTVLKAINAKNFKEIKLPVFKNADHVYFGKTTRDSKVTMLGLISAQFPRLSYTYNWNNQKLTQWVLPSAPEVNLQKFSVSRLLKYETRDGVKIPMFVRFPEKCEKNYDCPVVVHFHGGPEGQSQPGFNVYAQAIVDAGFIFVEPNVRGSDGYGKAWIDSDNGPKRENVITDIADAAIWIKNNWRNSKGEAPKIGVMGWSYGGYSTLMAMTRFAGEYDAGVALVGMSNLVSFLNNTAPYRRKLRISEYGDPEKDKEILTKLSPITYVDQVQSPLMIVQGANDPRVPVGEAIQMYEKIKNKKIDAQLILFADEGHGSSKKENQVLELGHTIEFFKKHLLN